MPAQIAVDRARIAELCRRHGILRLSIFGSVLRNDFRPESDIDFLVRWRPDARPDALSLFDVEQDFSALFGGRKVDLVDERHLYHRLRDRVLASSRRAAATWSRRAEATEASRSASPLLVRRSRNSSPATEASPSDDRVELDREGATARGGWLPAARMPLRFPPPDR